MSEKEREKEFVEERAISMDLLQSDNVRLGKEFPQDGYFLVFGFRFHAMVRAEKGTTVPCNRSNSVATKKRRQAAKETTGAKTHQQQPTMQ